MFLVNSEINFVCIKINVLFNIKIISHSISNKNTYVSNESTHDQVVFLLHMQMIIISIYKKIDFGFYCE